METPTLPGALSAIAAKPLDLTWLAELDLKVAEELLVVIFNSNQTFLMSELKALLTDSGNSST